MSKDKNWWDDPANQEIIKKISWWEHEQNKTTFPIPVSVIKSENHYVAGFNSDTEKLLGWGVHSGVGETEEEAILNIFESMNMITEYYRHTSMRYERFVPFLKGDWGKAGGNWFAIFGLHFNFRYGHDMKYGWYIPFTKLNISFRNKWNVK